MAPRAGDGAAGPSDLTPLLPSTIPFNDGHDGYMSASLASAVFSLSTSIVGAGIMGLPATIKTTGLIPGILLILFTAFFAQISVDALLKYSQAGKCVSYAGVMADAFGRPGRTLLQVCIIVNNFGLLVIYLIIIGDVLSGSWSSGVHHTGILEEWAGVSTWWNSRIVVMFITTVFILLPLACFKHVDSLELSSALSVALAVVFVTVIAGISIVKLLAGKVKMPALFPQLHSGTSVLNLFSVVPVVVTAYICHHAVHPILNELKNPAEGRSAVKISLILCTGIYVATSLFGYLLFGNQIMDDVLSNFDTDLGVPYSNVLSDIVRVGYAVHLMLVFPLLHFSLRLNLDGLIFPHSPPLSTDIQRFSLLTAVLISFSFLGASFIPSIWDAFQFTGSTSAVCVGFIFPGIIVLRDAHGIATRRETWISWAMVLLAISSSVIAISVDIYGAFQ